MKPKIKKCIKKRPDWYHNLIEDCRDIIVEHGFAARWALIEGYHALGARIMEDHYNFERVKIYGDKIVQRVAKSLGKGERSVAYAVKFAKTFPDLAILKEGKNISWHEVCHKYLNAAPDKIEHDQLITCPKCGHKFERKR